MTKKRGRGLVVLATLVAGLCAVAVLHLVGALVLADTQAAMDVYVDDDYSPAACTSAALTWGTDCFKTVQKGVNNVAVGGTVHVNDGSYAEQVVITKQDITVKAAAGQSPKIVTTDDNFNVLVKINATGVTLNGLALESPGRHSKWTGVEVHRQNASLLKLEINKACEGNPKFGVFAYNDEGSNASGMHLYNSHLACGEEAVRLRSGTGAQDNVFIRDNELKWWVRGIHGEDAPLSNLRIERNRLLGWPAFSEYAIGLYSQSHANAGSIVNNLVEGWRAGAYTIVVGSATANSRIDIINNTIVDNDRGGSGASGQRGAILIRGCKYKGVIKNNVVVGNSNIGLYGNLDQFGATCDGSPATEPRAPYAYQSGFAVDYNDFHDNGGGNYSGVAPGTHDIHQAPSFVGAAGGDFSLQGSSPCVDAGTNSGAPTSDLVGASRPFDGNGDGTKTTDMGAYEFSGPIQTLEVIKDLNPDQDPGRFNLLVDDGTWLADAGDGDSTGSRVVAVGKHLVAEKAASGTKLGLYNKSIECRDQGGKGSVVARSNNAGPLEVDVKEGDRVVCTITNERKRGRLQVVKALEPAKDQGRFNLQIDGKTRKADAGDGDASNRILLDTGTHTVSEVAGTGTVLLDYTSKIRCRDEDGAGKVVASRKGTGPLEVEIKEDDKVVCTFTNSRLGSITIVKDAWPDEPQEFPFTGDLGRFSVIGSNSTVFSKLVPSTYKVTELVPGGWELDEIVCADRDGGTNVDLGQATATIDLNPGEAVTCTYRNRKQSTIIVEKKTDPEGAGTGFKFSGDLQGEIRDGQQITKVVDPGTYTSQETVVAGWDLTSITCQDPSGDSWGNPATGIATYKVGAGETVKCVFTNSKRGRIVVEKRTFPGGAAETFSFEGDLTTSLKDGKSASKEVGAGTYRVSELVPNGWLLAAVRCEDPSDDSSGDPQARAATFRVAAGETVKCTFVNARNGTITVEKDARPNGTEAFSFRGDLGRFDLVDKGGVENAKTFTNRRPGDYDVKEVVPAGWGLTDIVCADGDGGTRADLSQATATIDFSGSEAILCTFVNTGADMEITKKASSTEVAVGGRLTYTLEFSNNGGVDYPDVVIVDEVPVALTAVEWHSTWPMTAIGPFKYTWDVGHVAVGKGGTITVSGVVDPNLTSEASFENSAEVSGALVDKDPSNNKDSVTVIARPAFRVLMPLLFSNGQ